MRFRQSFVLLVAAIACSLAVTPALAQSTSPNRAFVASYGNDASNTTCSFAQPCRTFQNAVNNVAAGGEVVAIDSAGFGSLTITQSVTITSPKGVEAGIVANPGSDAIAICAPGSSGNTCTISGAPNITVVLRGLTLEGNGTTPNGIDFYDGGTLEIIGCKIHNFASTGISIAPVSGAGAASILVKDTVISDNAQDGIFIYTLPSGATIRAAFDEVVASDNGTGIHSGAFNAAVELLISNSHIENSKNQGLYLQGSNSAAGTAMLKNVTFNEATGIALAGYANVYLSGVTQTTAPGLSNGFGITFSGTNNAAYSDNTNKLMGGYGGGAALQSWPLQ
jgi:hypothetical protein